MDKAKRNPLDGPKDQIDIECKSHLLGSETARFQAPEEELKTIPWREFDVPPPSKAMPVDGPDPESQKSINTMDPDLLELLHSELEADPEANSLSEFDAKLRNRLCAQFAKSAGEIETESQIEGEKELYNVFVPEIAKRGKNFFNGEFADFSNIEVVSYFNELQGLVEIIETDLQKLRGIDGKQALKMVFSRVYNFVISFHAQSHGSSGLEYRLFDKNHDIYNEVFEACFFMSLCMFLYETKRTKGKSLRKFIYEHSPQKYNMKGSSEYFDYEERPREFLESSSDKPKKSSSLILDDEDTLRQYRKRLLDNRPVYHHSSEGSAIRRVSEHEWTLYFLLKEADDEIRDTEKRIRNLYKGLNRAFGSKMDEGYIGRLDKAASKFCSKLEKIQYDRFLNLGNYCLAHINKDTTCYGINLYRFEKELRLYRITNDVNRLIECKSEAERERIVEQSIRMDKIVFPKLYEHFCNLPDIDLAQAYANTFWMFMDEVVQSSRLIIDKFVEDGIFGEDWEQLFLETTNELAKAVLYNPSAINYSLTPESQQEFQIYLLEPVDYRIKREKIRFFQSMSQLESDDEI